MKSIFRITSYNVCYTKLLRVKKLIDYLAVDVKCSFKKYKQITGYENEIKENILKIIDICKREGIFVECRTTFIPGLMVV